MEQRDDSNVMGRARTWVIAAVALASWGTLIADFTLFQKRATVMGIPRLGATMGYFCYMTHLTVLLLAVIYTVTLLARRSAWLRRLFHSSLPSAAFVYAVMIATVYHFMLRDQHDPQGLWTLVGRSLHYVLPAMYVCFWFLSTPRGTLRWRCVATWQLFPVLYVLVVLALGMRTGQYPYPFLDVDHLGWLVVVRTSLTILAGYIAMGLVVVWLDGLLATWKNVRTANDGQPNTAETNR